MCATAACTPAGEDDDPRPGLLALAERLEEREAEAFARLRADWLAGAADDFFEAVPRPASASPTAPPAWRRSSAGSCSPRARHRAGVRPAGDRAGLAAGHRVVERIRPLGPGHAGHLPHHQPRHRDGTAEPEGEVEPALFEAIWPLTAGRRVAKRRHVVPDYGLQWEIDQYLDRDLVIARWPGPEDAP